MLKDLNSKLKLLSWEEKEREIEFDISNIIPNRKFNTRKDFIQAIRNGAALPYSERDILSQVGNYLSWKETNDLQYRITKVKGEYVPNPFSWEVGKPRSIQYYLEMIVIYILDNHLNKDWSKYDWCYHLGLLISPDPHKDISSLGKSGEYFDPTYDVLKQVAKRKYRKIFEALEKKGVIKRKYKVYCREKGNKEWRPLQGKEKTEYKAIVKTILKEGSVDSPEKTLFYSDIYWKVVNEREKSESLKNLQFKLIIDADYLYPEEHSYMREYEYLLYKRRVLQDYTWPRTFKLACGRKQMVVDSHSENIFNHLSSLLSDEYSPELKKHLKIGIQNYAHEYHSQYRTHVRKVLNFIFA